MKETGKFFMWFRKGILIILLLSGYPSLIQSQSLYFPPVSGNQWDTISPLSLGWCVNEIDSLDDFLISNNTKAFILLKDGKIAIERYYGTFTIDSAWYWASAGKSLMAMLVGIAEDEGFLHINDPSSDHLGLGWTSAPPNKEIMITVRDQLTMTSGLDDGVPDIYCTDDTCLQYLADAGTRWAYHNGPYTLLRDVVENATGQNLNIYLNQKILSPTGMTGLYFPLGYNYIFLSKARSMARYGLLALNNGNWDGTQILNDPMYFDDMVNTSQSLNESYGYLWWLNGKSSFMVPGLQTVFPGSWNPSAPADMFAAMGANGQIINVVPSQNLVYVRMGDAPFAGEVPLLFNDTLWQKLNNVMCAATEIEDHQKYPPVNIFPNPSDGNINIHFPEPVYMLSVSEMSGKVLLRMRGLKRGSTNLDLSFLRTGVYLVGIIGRSGTLTHSVIMVQ